MNRDEAIDVVTATVVGTGAVALGLSPMKAAVLQPIVSAAIKNAVKRAIGKSATEQFEEVVAEEIQEAIFRRGPEVERQLRALATDGRKPNVADFVRVVDLFSHAWANAGNAEKRERLEAAFVRSFDKELYEADIIRLLWEKIEALGYSDLCLLKDLCEAGEHRNEVKKRWRLEDHDSLGRVHAKKLATEDVVWNPYAHQIESIRPNDLGKRLYKLAWEQLPDPGQGEPDGSGDAG